MLAGGFELTAWVAVRVVFPPPRTHTPFGLGLKKPDFQVSGRAGGEEWSTVQG